MRVIFITPFYVPELHFGGPPQKVHAFARHLCARDVTVEVFTFFSGNRTRSEAIDFDHVPVTYVPWVGSGARQFPHSLVSLRRAIERTELVHCFGLYNFLVPAAARFAHKRRLPMFIEPLGMYPPRLRNVMFKRLYHRFFTRSLFRQAHRVVANSDAEAAELRKEVPADRCVIRRNGIQTEEFASLPPPTQFRRQFGIRDTDKLLLFLGRISPIKNLEGLIQSFVTCRVPDAKLVIAGPEMEPDYAASVRQLALTSGAADRIIFPGPLYGEAKLAALSAASLFVLPSHSESFGNAAGEAVAAGLPVVLTNTCGISPIIDGKCGRSVSPNVEQLAAAIHDLLVDPTPYCDADVRAAVLRQLSWQGPVSQMIALYKEAIASN